MQRSNNRGNRNVSNIFDCPTEEPKILMDEMLTTELLLVSFTAKHPLLFQSKPKGRTQSFTSMKLCIGIIIATFE